jgi:hypothetical protein
VKLLLNEKPFKARTAGADIDESSWRMKIRIWTIIIIMFVYILYIILTNWIIKHRHI